MTRVRTRWALTAGVAIALCACDGPVPPADGSTPPIDGGGESSVATPTPPASPTLAPCPGGWREASADGVVTCEPWPETGPPACVPGTMALPGVAGCADLGTECPAGDLPDEPTTGGPFVYVLAGTTGGDGSRFAPFATIGEAMAFASPGSTILVGRGTYDERVVPGAGITLRGACARLTVLTRSDTAGGEAIVSVARDGVTLQDLTISGSPRYFGLVARAGATHLEGVVIEDLGAPGIGAADAATVTVTGSMIRRCAHGIEIIAGGTVELAGSVITDNAGPGLVAIGGSAIVRDSWVADNRNVGEPGFGALAQDGGQVTMAASVVSGNADVGLTVGAGGTIEARDTLVDDQRPDPAGDAGFGVEGEAGGIVHLERVTVRRSRMGGVFMQGAGTSLVATDLLVLDTQARPDGRFGRALVVQDGAEASVTRGVFSQSSDTGVLVSGNTARATLRLEDVEVRDTVAQPSDGESGRAISVQYEAQVELERVRVARCLGVGVHIAGRDGRAPTASLVDLDVVDVDPEIAEGVAGSHGRALQIEVGAVVTGTRVRSERAHEVALVVFEASADLSDVTILDTRARTIDDTIGRGVVVQGGGTLALDRALIQQTRDVALFVSGAGSRVVAQHLTLRDALARGCAESTCAAAPAGHGLGVYEQGSAELTDFAIERAVLCGVHLGVDAAIDLHHGVVRGSRFGACVQVDGYDVGRLSDDVRYEDNEINLDSTTLPIPESIDGLEL